jgi:predicted transcriptional regulator
MELQQEVEAFYIIPAVRRELARQLVALGLTQRDVAKRLGVTDAAISQYLSNKRGSPIDYGQTVAHAIAQAAARIKNSTSDAIIRKEIDALCILLKRERVICDIHRKNSSVKDGCESCFE